MKNYLVLALILNVLAVALASGGGSTETILTVDVEITAPCVMYDNGTYTGFDIELWEEIAQELELDFSYKETDLKGIFKDITEGKADVAFSCITVTE